MNIGTIGNMAVIAKGWTIISFGFRLINKKGKNEEEKKAAKSFSLFISLVCVLTFLCAIIIFVNVTITFVSIRAGFGGDTRYGRVESGYIRYVQGENKYLSISDAGLDEYALNDGDRIIMVFNRGTDELRSVMPEKQYERTLILNVTALLCTMVGSVLVLMVFGFIAQGTFGRPFALFYNLSLKRENAAWESDERKRIYEELYIQTFAQRKTIWLSVLIAVVVLLLLGGIGLSGVLISGKVYTLLPNQELILFSRIFGAISGLLYIGLMFFLVKYDNNVRLLYSVGEHLLETQLLTRNVEGKIGYYTVRGNWMELLRVKIKRQDENIVKIKCIYKGDATGKTFSDYNYIAKNDPIFHLVMEVSDSKRETPPRNTRYVLQLLLILCIYVILLVSNIILLKERDKGVAFSQTNGVEYILRR